MLHRLLLTATLALAACAPAHADQALLGPAETAQRLAQAGQSNTVQPFHYYGGTTGTVQLAGYTAHQNAGLKCYDTSVVVKDDKNQFDFHFALSECALNGHWLPQEDALLTVALKNPGKTYTWQATGEHTQPPITFVAGPIGTNVCTMPDGSTKLLLSSYIAFTHSITGETEEIILAWEDKTHAGIVHPLVGVDLFASLFNNNDNAILIATYNAE